VTTTPAESQALLHTLGSERIVTHFQPILSARQKSVIGLEALSRGAVSGASVMAANTLFEIAEAAGVGADLDALCRRQAVQTFSVLTNRPDDILLFLNLHVPDGVAATRIASDLSMLVASAGLNPATIALEILEAEITDLDQLRTLVDLLRGAGFLIALDDVGVGHSNLDRIPIIKPDLLKIDRALISRIDSDYHKRGAVKSLVDLSRKIGALVVAEGVETEAEALVSLELGADLLQGYLLGKPRAHESMHGEGIAHVMSAIERLARRFRDHMVGKITERRLQHRQFSVVMNQILCDLTTADVDQFDAILEQTIARYPQVECAYVLDHLGVQVTNTVCHPGMRVRNNGALFHPAPKGADHSLKEYYYVLLDVELHRYTTDPYVSLASGSVSRTVSTYFRGAQSSRMYVLCIDVLSD
jgi:EAL domain-containing protein (putative c-di-GMP-specific phosphodiesterase class I)